MRPFCCFSCENTEKHGKNAVGKPNKKRHYFVQDYKSIKQDIKQSIKNLNIS